VSVVVSARDRPAVLERCLAALARGVEINVVDDGSADAAVAIAPRRLRGELREVPERVPTGYATLKRRPDEVVRMACQQLGGRRRDAARRARAVPRRRKGRHL
jgi:hypothetical protein